MVGLSVSGLILHFEVANFLSMLGPGDNFAFCFSTCDLKERVQFSVQQGASDTPFQMMMCCLSLTIPKMEDAFWLR